LTLMYATDDKACSRPYQLIQNAVSPQPIKSGTARGGVAYLPKSSTYRTYGGRLLARILMVISGMKRPAMLKDRWMATVSLLALIG
jgi:hypothetical protein